jgi:hypothetical protein
VSHCTQNDGRRHGIDTYLFCLFLAIALSFDKGTRPCGLTAVAVAARRRHITACKPFKASFVDMQIWSKKPPIFSTTVALTLFLSLSQSLSLSRISLSFSLFLSLSLSRASEANLKSRNVHLFKTFLRKQLPQM